MKYDGLLKEAEDNNIEVTEKRFKSHASALCKGNKIAINKALKNQKEKACALAEELGHYHTTCGDITWMNTIPKTKQELLARGWAYKSMVGLMDIIRAYNAGVRDRYELADYLEVTDAFLDQAVEYYKQKYGLYYCIDEYIIYFEPLGILKMFPRQE